MEKYWEKVDAVINAVNKYVKSLNLSENILLFKKDYIYLTPDGIKSKAMDKWLSVREDFALFVASDVASFKKLCLLKIDEHNREKMNKEEIIMHFNINEI